MKAELISLALGLAIVIVAVVRFLTGRRTSDNGGAVFVFILGWFMVLGSIANIGLASLGWWQKGPGQSPLHIGLLLGGLVLLAIGFSAYKRYKGQQKYYDI
jgi:hypothetical protein